jgi:predicted nucleic acid-binding protein
MYLMDTNVISEMRKTSAARGDAAVRRWAGSVDQSALFLSVITVLEVQMGVLRMMRKDAVQGELLRRWLHQAVLPAFRGRILEVDAEIALRGAALHVPVTIAYYDALIAATAMIHGMTVVTRNVADFAPMGVSVLNPWQT